MKPTMGCVLYSGREYICMDASSTNLPWIDIVERKDAKHLLLEVFEGCYWFGAGSEGAVFLPHNGEQQGVFSYLAKKAHPGSMRLMGYELFSYVNLVLFQVRYGGTNICYWLWDAAGLGYGRKERNGKQLELFDVDLKVGPVRVVHTFDYKTSGSTGVYGSTAIMEKEVFYVFTGIMPLSAVPGSYLQGTLRHHHHPTRTPAHVSLVVDFPDSITLNGITVPHR